MTAPARLPRRFRFRRLPRRWAVSINGSSAVVLEHMFAAVTVSIHGLDSAAREALLAARTDDQLYRAMSRPTIKALGDALSRGLGGGHA